MCVLPVPPFEVGIEIRDRVDIAARCRVEKLLIVGADRLAFGFGQGFRLLLLGG